MTNNTASSITTEYREPRPVMQSPRRYDPTKPGKPGFTPNHAAAGKPATKRPPQRNLEPHERILANAKREGLSILVELLNEDETIVGRVMDFGKYEVIVETEDGARMCLFKSALRSFHVIHGA